MAADNRPGISATNITAMLTAAVVIAAGIVAIAFGVWYARRGRDGRYTYDLTALRRTDPNLLVCRQVAAWSTGLAGSRAVTIGPGGEVCVVGDREIRRFDPGGKRLGALAVDCEPAAVAVDADGTAYVAATDHVEVYAPAGGPKARWPVAGAKAAITAIALGGKEVFVADAGGRVVLRYDRSGKLLGTIGRKDTARNIPGLLIPSPNLDLAMGPDALLWVINPGRHRIEAYTPDGDLEFSWGKPSAAVRGFCGCCNPVSFALLPGGSRRGEFGGFVTCEKGLTRVKIYDADGKFVGVVAGPESFRRHDELIAGRAAGEGGTALKVAVDSSGRIFVLDPVMNEVKVFERIPSAPAAGAKP